MKPNVEMYFNRILRRVAGFFPAKAKVLDVGCGEGDDALLLHGLGCRVLGIDIEKQRAWKKLRAPGLTFAQASAESLPYSAASFDAIWAKDALHHMEHPEQAIGEFLRVAKPRAPIVIVEANRYNPIFYVHMTLMEGHEHFSRRKFRGMLRAVDPNFRYFMLESRCLPWSNNRVLQALEWFENSLEAVSVLDPWLTYQVGIIRGKRGVGRQ